MHNLNLMDSQSVTSFVTQQSAHIESQVYRIKYPDLQYADLLPIDTSAGEHARTIEFFSMDMVGKAAWFNANSRDVPRADVLMAKGTHAISMAAIGYGYNTDEIGYAARLGIGLDSERASSARRAYEEFVNGVAFYGDTEKGWTGLLNNAGVNAANVPADGTGSSRLWSAKTPIQILRDINEALTAVVTGSNRTEMADTVLLPLDSFIHISTTPMSADFPNQTIFDYIMKSNTYTAMTGRPLTIRVCDGLENAGASSTGRMVVYRKDPQVVKLHLPVPLRFLPVWQTGPMLYEVPGYFKLGGVEVRLPGAVRYRDGITA